MNQVDKVRSFEGASILVVGATGVLGSHLAVQLQRLGATLTITGRDPVRLANLSTQLPGSAAVRADIRDAASAEKLVSVASLHGGKLDGVVIASGVVAFGELSTVDPVTMEELFLTNALAPLWIIRQALEPLSATRGFVAAISGIVVEQPTPNMATYSASKAALSSSLAAIGVEARRRNVLVVDARPPHTETGLSSRPIEGRAPTLPTGLDPSSVATSIINAVATGVTQLSSISFSN